MLTDSDGVTDTVAADAPQGLCAATVRSHGHQSSASSGYGNSSGGSAVGRIHRRRPASAAAYPQLISRCWVLLGSAFSLLGISASSSVRANGTCSAPGTRKSSLSP